jgi:chorismate mutase
MHKDRTYFLVDREALPPVFGKVVEVKKILNEERTSSVNEAVKIAGISRSTYYKYKDHIFQFYEMSKGREITLLIQAEDIKGVLSEILGIIAAAKANVLTIDQNLPRNGMADIIIRIETEDMVIDLRELFKRIDQVKGVHNQDVIAGK